MRIDAPWLEQAKQRRLRDERFREEAQEEVELRREEAKEQVQEKAKKEITACHACRQEFTREFIQRDHRVPRSIGGNQHKNNLQWLCMKCHQEKSRLERNLFQFYTKTSTIKRWYSLAFQNDPEKIRSWTQEMEIKVVHLREVLATVEAERLL